MISSTQKVNLIIADDHPVLANGLKDLLNKNLIINNIEIVGDGKALLAALKKSTPHLVILDINMPGDDGLQLASIIKSRYEKVKIMMFSSFVSEDYVNQCYELNVDGYLGKNTDPSQIQEAVLKIINGEKYFCETSKNIIFNILLEKDANNRFKPKSDSLTAREREILRYICLHKKNKHIAEALSLSENTIRKHRQNILSKINCHNATDLYEYAIINNIISSPKKVNS